MHDIPDRSGSSVNKGEHKVLSFFLGGEMGIKLPAIIRREVSKNKREAEPVVKFSIKIQFKEEKILQLLVLALISLLPGIFWLWYFYRKDSLNPEPLSMVIKSFLWGMVVVIPVGIIEAPFSAYISAPRNFYQLFLLSFVVVGITEELFKGGVVYLGPFQSREFEEPVDGIIYAVSAALGFAVLENLMYSVLFGREVGIIRGVLTTLAHASFSGFFGYILGLARVREGHDFVFFLKGLLVAAFFHGLYDFIVIGGLLPFSLVVLLILGFQLYLAALIESAKKLPG